jgi:hypothetical protein
LYLEYSRASERGYALVGQFEKYSVAIKNPYFNHKYPCGDILAINIHVETVKGECVA